MALHQLVNVNHDHKIMQEIDFELFLKLSHGQCLILEQGACQYFGNRLPDRAIIVVGTDTGMLPVDHLVSTVDDAVMKFRETGLKDAVAVGFTRLFNRQMLRHSDKLHYYRHDTKIDRRYHTFPELDEQEWLLEFKEHLDARPFWRSFGVCKHRYIRK